ncbi:MAG: hypothetical protein P4L53_08010 [Candidatus Obscuribacterales bacterium]|nr:hypothetical protein [Candidatus Obscuribacterales bacterium]
MTALGAKACLIVIIYVADWALYHSSLLYMNTPPMIITPLDNQHLSKLKSEIASTLPIVMQMASGRLAFCNQQLMRGASVFSSTNVPIDFSN